MKNLWYIIFLLSISCSSNQIGEQEAREIHEMINQIQDASEDLIRNIQRQVQNAEYLVKEQGLENEQLHHIEELKKNISQVVIAQKFYDNWEDNLIDNYGGLEIDHNNPMPINWHEKIELQNYKPKEANHGITNSLTSSDTRLLLALLELSNQEYAYTKKVHDQLLSFCSENFNLNQDISPKMEMINHLEHYDHIDSTYQLWSVDYAPLKRVVVNGQLVETDNGVLKYSLSEWESSDIKSIGVQLRDTTLNFQINPQ